MRGGLIGAVKANLMSHPVLTFAASAAGKQKPERFEGEAKDVLEASKAGGAYTQVGLIATIALVPEGFETVEGASAA